MVFLWFDEWQIFSEQLLFLIGFAITFYSILKNTDANKTKLLHEMNCEERNISIKLFELTRDINNNTNNKTKEKNKLKMEQDVLIAHYLNFLEHLSLLINTGKINEKIAKRYWKTIIKQATDIYPKKIFPIYKEIIKLSQKWDE